MSDIAIKFENISKQYQLGNFGTGTLSHDLNRWWAMNIRGKEDPNLKIGQINDRVSKANGEYIWALKDINFEVKQGEVLGIIGKNGAGKSTLLKILSRVTSPTTGRITAHGRIASLLEIGTGFHPEMTGRENIYMNGAIMGMSKSEITKKFDEIVDFSGIEKYIDAPVKRFSSGMTVRLGFAIAAHLEPEILVVDEVLAVGDAEFQKKAIGKMQNISRGEGRTVLFVSHSMQAISALTTQSVLLFNGQISVIGNTSNVINQYLSSKDFNQLYVNSNIIDDKPYVKRVEIKCSHNGNIHEHGKMLEIEFIVKSPFQINSPAISYQIINSNQQSVLHILNLNSEVPFCQKRGTYVLKSIIPKCTLYPDNYHLKVHFADQTTKNKFETIDEICQFEVKVFSELRDFYWYPSHAVYVEDNHWIIDSIE
jgi:lipopolysaccharide transport system ATP-binding protein